MPAECPNCRVRIPFLGTFTKTLWSRWECAQCGSLLAIDVKRRLLGAAMCGAVPFLIIFISRRMGLNYQHVMPSIIIVIGVVLYFLDSVVVIERTGHRCRRCGYDLQGQIDARCPECGEAFDVTKAGAVRRSRRSLGRRRAVDRVIVAVMIGLVVLNLLGLYVLRRAQRKAQAAAPAVALADVPEAEPQRLAGQMEQIFHAARAYHRDFGQWPESVETLIGRFLPQGFELSPGLTFRPVPPSRGTELDWVLIFSEPVAFDLEGNALDQPHRLRLRLNGEIDLIAEQALGSLVLSGSDDDGSKP
jgi:predicted  nucleic acid-binding Zn-ribbon protein